MDREEKIVELLTEIRDTHREHLDAYREFTAYVRQGSEERLGRVIKAQEDRIRIISARSMRSTIGLVVVALALGLS
jgi:hypothetical protein